MMNQQLSTYPAIYLCKPYLTDSDRITVEGEIGPRFVSPLSKVFELNPAENAQNDERPRHVE